MNEKNMEGVVIEDCTVRVSPATPFVKELLRKNNVQKDEIERILYEINFWLFKEKLDLEHIKREILFIIKNDLEVWLRKELKKDDFYILLKTFKEWLAIQGWLGNDPDAQDVLNIVEERLGEIFKASDLLKVFDELYYKGIVDDCYYSFLIDKATLIF